MTRNQKNFTLQTYVDNDGVSWNLRGESGGAAAAVDGHATYVATQQDWPRRTRRYEARRIVYTDPTTFRKVFPVIYTPTAFNAIAIGDIVAVQVAGLATTVNYAATRKLAEKKPSRAPQGPSLPDA